ncbi:MAG TPA: DUF5916 domain-containing protein [Longimicrobium sp.]
MTSRMRRLTALVVPAALWAAHLDAQGTAAIHPTPPLVVRAEPRAAVVVLDGVPDEDAWRSAAPATQFTQTRPREGSPATQRTEVRFLYDESALYVGARMYDSLGAAGVTSRLTRRDDVRDGDSDYLMLVLDAFHDHLSRAQFFVTPSGVRRDALGLGGAEPDPAWDPVWEAAARVDSLGWTAEMRIPFSQLRFSPDEGQTWGVNLIRNVQRLNERVFYAWWRLNELGGAPRFNHLEGLRVGRRPARVEAVPYTVAGAVRGAGPADGLSVRGGIDARYPVTSSMTLDATLNPDFGQVEVDPAVVNLTAFETFHPEKRPFFVEGGTAFAFGEAPCFLCSDTSPLNLFFARRIGREPQHAAALRRAYPGARVPSATEIAAAAKLTGRSRGGTTLGLLAALTRPQHVDAPDTLLAGTRRIALEPAAVHLVGRVKRDYRGGATVLGAFGTLVSRTGNDSALADLTRRAVAGGVDAKLFWGGQTYSLTGQLAGSHLVGEPAAMLRVQRSSARYFQRPDRRAGSGGLFADRLDPAATSLAGYGAHLRLAKDAGDWLWEGAASARSPGFDTNELGFLPRADYVWTGANVMRQWTRPTRWTRTANVVLGAQQQRNYDGNLTGRELHLSTTAQLASYWTMGALLVLRPELDDDRLSRGGPVVRRAAAVLASGRIGTDARSPLFLLFSPSAARAADGGWTLGASLNVRWKAAPSVVVSLTPAFASSRTTDQFVAGFSDSTATHFHAQRVVFAHLRQRSASVEARVNLTFTPALTLELFAQPLIASGDFSRYREFLAPRTRRTMEYDTLQLHPVRSAPARDSLYRIDPDRDPGTPGFSFANPDFTLRSMRANAVVRWEYRPGSTLFLVWQQRREGTTPDGSFRLVRAPAALWDTRGQNTLVLKLSYWFDL